MIILAIETSCDETALALVATSGGIKNPTVRVLRSAIASQVKIHEPFGGVVPNLAKREHLKNLPILYKKILGASTREIALLKTIDAIAVTVGPGLEPALWAGITFAKELTKKYKKPLVGTNHLEGHLYSFLLQKNADTQKIFPAIGLIVSGGHTILLKLDSLTKKTKLGETRDDAAGECFDKVARLLKLPYPGGPELEKLARKGKPNAIEFPRPMLNQKNYDFSFSGLKTSVLYYLRDNPKFNKASVAASAQEAIVDVLAQKTMRAVREFGARSVLLSGGVAANKALRNRLRRDSKKLGAELLVADFKHNTDNAAMIAVASYVNLLRRKNYKLEAKGNLNL